MLDEQKEASKHLRIALFITIFVIALELAGGYFSGSISLLSDSGHVFTDAMAIILSLFAVGLSSRHHKGAMTFGYHRAEILAALANGVALAGISVIIGTEALQRLLVPHQLDIQVMLPTAVLGLVGNLVVVKLLRPHSSKSINVRSTFAHVVYDAISSVAVILTGLIAFFTGITVVDTLVALLIAGFIARSSYSMVKESTHILLEGAPHGLNLQEIISTLKQIDGIIDIHDLHIWTITTGMHALSGHVEVKDQMVSQSREIIEKINRLVSEKYHISHTTIQLDPEKGISFRRRL